MEGLPEGRGGPSEGLTRRIGQNRCKIDQYRRKSAKRGTEGDKTSQSGKAPTPREWLWQSEIQLATFLVKMVFFRDLAEALQAIT